MHQDLLKRTDQNVRPQQACRGKKNVRRSIYQNYIYIYIYNIYIYIYIYIEREREREREGEIKEKTSSYGHTLFICISMLKKLIYAQSYLADILKCYHKNCFTVCHFQIGSMLLRSQQNMKAALEPLSKTRL